MPAANVKVEATFHNPTYQAAWEAARKIIEAATFTLTQQQAPNEATARYVLAEQINELLKNNSQFSIYSASEIDTLIDNLTLRNVFNSQFAISAYDIVIYTFIPANSGTSDNANGVNGRFEFRVTPPNTPASAYNKGTITASPVSNDQLHPELDSGTNYELRGWVHNSTLYVSGLQPGTKWGIYTLSGALIYTGIAVETHGRASLHERGIYIVVSNGKTVKVVY
jgi:hypothetical protein